jgi:hypothetical protein
MTLRVTNEHENKLKKMKPIHVLLIGLALLALGIYMGSVNAKANGQIATLAIQVGNVDARLTTIEKAQAEHNNRWRFLNRMVDFGRRFFPWT